LKKDDVAVLDSTSFEHISLAHFVGSYGVAAGYVRSGTNRPLLRLIYPVSELNGFYCNCIRQSHRMA